MKWFVCLLLSPLMLAGCSAPPRVLEIGTTRENVASQQRAAIKRLSDEIKSNPQDNLILIRWVFDNKGKKSNSELAYNKRSGTLTLDKSKYSNVTDQTIASLAKQQEGVEQITKYGASIIPH